MQAISWADLCMGRARCWEGDEVAVAKGRFLGNANTNPILEGDFQSIDVKVAHGG